MSVTQRYQKLLQVFHPLSLAFLKMLLEYPSLCRAEVAGPGQAEFRECPSMTYSNTRFQIGADDWETRGGVRVGPTHPVPGPDHMSGEQVSSVPEASRVRDPMSRNGRALIQAVRHERET